MPKNAGENDQHSTQTQQDDNIMGRQRLNLCTIPAKMNQILYISEPIKQLYMMKRRKTNKKVN